MNLYFLIILIFCSGLKTQIFNPVEIDTLKLKSSLKSLYVKNRLASLSFGVFQGMKFKKFYNFGYHQLTKKIKTDESIYYPLASVTKPLTGALMINAADSGYLKYSDFVRDYIPDFPEKITIRDLLVHDSGINRYKNYHKLLNTDSLGDIDQFIPTSLNRRKKFKYTNLNYAFLGRILEKVYHLKFEEIAERYFHHVLGNEDNIYFMTQKPDSITIANTYVLKGRRRYPHKFFVSDIWKPAALGLSNSKNLLNFLRVHMNQSYIKEVINYPEYVKKRWYYDGQDNEERYGYGFRLLFSDNQLIYVYHNGFMFGALSTIYYLPQYDIGFVALTNTSGYPKQKINFSSRILSIVKMAIKNRTKLNKHTQNMYKIKQF